MVEILRQVEADPERYQEFRDLPLVTTGCDTYASIYPEFKRFNRQADVYTIADEIHALLPQGTWDQEWSDQIHFIITGGEPFLAYQQLYPTLLDLLRKKGLRDVTVETNGSQDLYPEVRDYFFEDFTRSGRDYDRLTFSVSPKLPCSGERWENAIKPKVVKSYEMVGSTYLKFVVATRQDVEDAERAVTEYRDAGFGGPVYLMPAGGVPQVYNLNTQEVANLALEKGWRYSPRLQVDIYKNEWGT